MGSRKKQMADAIKANKKDVAFAKLNNCPTSPRKMRLVADQVRGQQVDKALSILQLNTIVCLNDIIYPENVTH